MPKFIKTETVAAYVTFTSELDADTLTEATEMFGEGMGELIYTNIGENVGALAMDADIKIKEKA